MFTGNSDENSGVPNSAVEHNVINYVIPLSTLLLRFRVKPAEEHPRKKPHSVAIADVDWGLVETMFVSDFSKEPV